MMTKTCNFCGCYSGHEDNCPRAIAERRGERFDDLAHLRALTEPKDDMLKRETPLPKASAVCPVCGIAEPHAHDYATLMTMIVKLKSEVPPQKPDWNAACEAMRWLNDIEAMQGGRNGPSIKLRSAIETLKAERAALRKYVNALLHQIDIGDYVDSEGHALKNNAAVWDLMKGLTNA